MVTAIEVIFFIYIFISFYMVSLFTLIYLYSRKELFTYPKGKPEPVSIIMPCYNAEKNIGKAIESLLDLDYPKDMIEIIVVDDKSTDGSVKEIKKYVKKYKNVRLIARKVNFGKAAGPTNDGVLAAKYDYIAVADDDSTPDRDALLKMIGFLQKDKKVGGVTCAVMAKNTDTFFEKLQAVEYTIISFTRKLLDMVDAVYVTPGPFALYRKKILIEIGLFDPDNMTQDIEIVWRMVSNGYVARMCLATKVYSVTPRRLMDWFRQRLRWNIGGLQTVMKYKSFFLRRGMLGAFIIPYFVMSLVIGLIGLGLFTYLIFRRVFFSYIATKLSVFAGTDIIRMSELNLNPAVLNFFGIGLFILGTLLSIFALTVMNERELRDKNKFMLAVYLLLYLSAYPIILITSVYKFARGNYRW